MSGGRASMLRGMPRRLLPGLAVAIALGMPAFAQSPPPSGIFDNVPTIGNDAVSISSNLLTYDANKHQATAAGHVVVDYQGYHIVGDRLIFDQTAHNAHFVGNVVVSAPDGITYKAPDMVLSGAMHQALMRHLVITTKSGALVTAGDGDMKQGDRTILDDATFSPCGQCIDSKGRHIGWSAKAVRMIYNHKTYIVTLDKPSLYLLGVPVANLPWLQLPDPTKRVPQFRAPLFDTSPQYGARLGLPYFIPYGPDTDFLLTPYLMSGQGVGLGAEWDQRFSNGEMKVKATGVYQLNPGAYAGQVGDRQFRGAFQTSGRFTPVKDWTVGWSYTAFTDPAYLTDYRYREYTNTGVTNEVYATQLTRNEYLDVRLQKFNLLGQVTDIDQDKQAAALPNIRYRNVLYLPQNFGEIDLTADLLGVFRGTDDVRTPVNGVPYNFGYAEAKAHGTVEADWQKRWIVPGGVAVTPFLGLRADAAYYDGSSPIKPGQIDLFNATPIAAVDVRYPLVIQGGPATQVVEPIAQLYYRGSDTTDVGITNDNAQSFVFDDTNLFSYNRFSGTDRQETGLRANLGAHYQANFDNGNWIDLIGGQSFQLAGPNAFAAYDPTQATTGQGLSANASYVVLGATGSPLKGLQFGSKVQIDPTAPRVTRFGVGGTYDIDGFTFNADYLYIGQDLARGVAKDQQEVDGGVVIPVDDYWKINPHASWDIANNSWLDAGLGVTYDDGYLTYGGAIRATGPTNIDPNDLLITATLNLKGLGP